MQSTFGLCDTTKVLVCSKRFKLCLQSTLCALNSAPWGSIRRGARTVHARCRYWGRSIDPFSRFRRNCVHFHTVCLVFSSAMYFVMFPCFKACWLQNFYGSILTPVSTELYLSHGFMHGCQSFTPAQLAGV